jgi:ABC-2 type transport system ATP-binding protein
MLVSAIHTEQLTKYYGRRRGIEDVSVDVTRGEVFGLLGPNGAGKTTLIRTLLDLVHATRGTASIFGLDTRRDGVEIRRRTGYVPGELALYSGMTGHEHVRYFAGLRDLADSGRATTLADRFDLELDRPAGVLSKGNRQKLAIVLAFMHRPELLLLDEPTSGLDPLLQQEFRALLKETVADGTTVFLSSHVLAEVEQTATRVAIVRGGRVATVERMEDLKERAVRRLEVRFSGNVDADPFRVVPGVREVHGEGLELVLVTEGSMDAIVKELARHEVVSLQTHALDLEEVFLSFFGEDAEP